eukprot:12891656-Prorocentrum_lima.AAC.1
MKDNESAGAYNSFKQSIESVAQELVRVTCITTTTLQKLARYGGSHRKDIDGSLMHWAASVEAQLREPE